MHEVHDILHINRFTRYHCCTHFFLEQFFFFGSLVSIIGIFFFRGDQGHPNAKILFSLSFSNKLKMMPTRFFTVLVLVIFLFVALQWGTTGYLMVANEDYIYPYDLFGFWYANDLFGPRLWGNNTWQMSTAGVMKQNLDDPQETKVMEGLRTTQIVVYALVALSLPLLVLGMILRNDPAGGDPSFLAKLILGWIPAGLLLVGLVNLLWAGATQCSFVDAPGLIQDRHQLQNKYCEEACGHHFQFV